MYCYTQTGTSPGIDHIYAEVFGFISDTSIVYWYYTPPCINPAGGGTISNDQSGCGSFIPSAISNLSLPSGQSGTLEYKWQESVIDGLSGFNDIPASNSVTWTPGLLTQSTWFRRLARVDCMSDWTSAAVSNVVAMIVNPVTTPFITISGSVNPVCQGTSVTFSALPVGEGTTPSLQWKVNGISSGTDSVGFTYIPANGDMITCILTSSDPCPSVNPVSSNTISMIVYPILPVSVTVAPSGNPVCSGTLVTFTANPSNPGLSPVYQWKMNGTGVGTNNQTYAYSPLNGDIITCTLASSEPCTSNNPAVSNPVSMTVMNYSAVDVSVSPSANPVCPGIPVTFTAIPLNGGLSPVYLWKVNGITVGSNSTTYNYIPAASDLVYCIFTSNLSCTTNNPALSNFITMSIKSPPVVSFIRCNDSITTTNAKPFRLKGGIPLGGIYSGAGVTNGIFNPAAAGVGNKQITYSYTNASLCSANAMLIIHVVTPPNFVCGNPLTDIRDNKTYSTVIISSQCWMAEVLNYGTEITPPTEQRDNCIAERYYNPTGLVGLPESLYQWDEVMQYNDSVSNQGLCPPGWHIPSESDWNTLFSNYINSGFAGSPLKYSGFSGFDAILSGFRPINKVLEYQGFTAFFWSSTTQGTLKAWAHGMNDIDPSVSAYPALKTNAFSVRCLKD